MGCTQQGAFPRVARPCSAPTGCHLLGGPRLPPGLGDLLKHPVTFLTLRCLIPVLVSSRNASEVFSKSSLFPLICIFLSRVTHLALSGVHGGSWCRWARPLGAARTHRCPEAGGAVRWSLERCARTGPQTCGRLQGSVSEKAMSVPHPEAGRPRCRRKVSEREAPGLQGAQARGCGHRPAAKREETRTKGASLYEAKCLPLKGHPLVIYCEIQ